MSAPPGYTQSVNDPPASTSLAAAATAHQDQVQLHINPSPDATQFQKGYLGVEGETAAFEGEVQIKGIPLAEWDKVTISLQSKETVATQSIELDARTLTIFSKSRAINDTETSLPFSIPIPPDAPQCIHTQKATVAHKLTATLYTTTRAPLHKSINVHTRRYSQRSAPPPVTPESYSITEPAVIQVELPRRTFYAGEIIPLYITVPPLDRTVLERKDLVLRNVTAELRRSVSLALSKIATPDRNSRILDPPPSTSSAWTGNEKSLQNDANSSYSRGAQAELRNNTLARSGAACRFHDTKPIKLRLLLHLPPAEPQIGPSSSSGEYQGENSDCGFISQTTLLHTVSFHLVIQAQFIKTPIPDKNSFSISIPVAILPPQAPATEVDASLDVAYAKKHDRPPAKTTRHPQAENFSTASSRDDYAPGPSGAPPPFEDPDPPPFSVSDPQALGRLPSFVESQADMGDFSLSVQDEVSEPPPAAQPNEETSGEGVLFGFTASDQFDGMGSNSRNSAAGPSFQEPLSNNAMDMPDAGTTGLESQAAMMLSPPPPPPMDDPLDPPPTIDVGYLTMPNSISVVQNQDPPTPSSVERGSAHDPPPYATPSSRNESSSVTNPPPYV